MTGDVGNREGDRVYLEGGRVGTVRYIGPIKTGLNADQYLGIELDEGFEGTSGGSIDGEEYFKCPPMSAVFVLPDDVIEVLKGKRRKNVYKQQDRVEVVVDKNGLTECGTVKYIGDSPFFRRPIVSYGIELDNTIENGGNGIYNNKKYFDCKPGTSIF